VVCAGGLALAMAFVFPGGSPSRESLSRQSASAGSSDDAPPGTEPPEVAVVGGSEPPAWMAPPPTPSPCPPATVRVTDGDSLRAALAEAGAGTVIELAEGTYRGRFTIDRAAEPAARAWLCG